jgi:SAM-dependent methyltransferase
VISPSPSSAVSFVEAEHSSHRRKGRIVYATRTDVPALADCDFYHTMDLPGYGVVRGDWDLRAGVDEYLGFEQVNGKRVLEIGTASGFLCFEMERRGAEVVGYDLSSADAWDVVPYAGLDLPAIAAARAAHIARLNNGWWLARHAYGSSARVVYGNAYDIPAAIGAIDVCTFGAVLLHLRDPLRALESAARLRPQTMIVTEPRRPRRLGIFPPSQRRSPILLADGRAASPVDVWWFFTPEAIANLLAIVGYRTIRVIRHRRLYRGRRMRMCTVVARPIDAP